MDKILEEFYKYNITHMENYVKNNPEIDENNYTIDEVIHALDLDLNIVFQVLNVQFNRVGLNYWKSAVILLVLSKKEKLKMFADVYFHVAKKYGKSVCSVERCMRLCFEDTPYFAFKDTNYIIDFMKSDLLVPHNSRILYKVAELISGKKFQDNKHKFIKIYNP